MKKDRKYEVRRFTAVTLLFAILVMFTKIAVIKSSAYLGAGIDRQFEREQKMLEEHFREHGVVK